MSYRYHEIWLVKTQDGVRATSIAAAGEISIANNPIAGPSGFCRFELKIIAGNSVAAGADS
jgi:hypothetical protein